MYRATEYYRTFYTFVSERKALLKNSSSIRNNYFCGRSTELSEIHNILKTETNFLILHGIDSIRKSEVAKHYAMTYKPEYDEKYKDFEEDLDSK